jgi:hypothetical protein
LETWSNRYSHSLLVGMPNSTATLKEFGNAYKMKRVFII